MNDKMKTVRKLFSHLLIICLLTSCFAVFAQASEGFVEITFMPVMYNTQGNAKRIIDSRSVLEDYTAWGKISIRPSYGEKFDRRGETYHAFFNCCAAYIEYVYGEDKRIPHEMKPVSSVRTFTADENTGTIEFISKKAEYKNAAECSGNAQYIWQIEADGDYNIIGSIGGLGFFSDMYQYY